jgi:Ice-binding-like/Bacterial Ig-like domain
MRKIFSMVPIIHKMVLVLFIAAFLLPLSAPSEVKAGSVQVSPFNGYNICEKGQNQQNQHVSGGNSDKSATVSSTVPVNGATGVLTNTKVTATFNGAMDPASITTTTFTVMLGTMPVAGTVTYSGVTAVFTPASVLAAGTVYTARITTGVMTLACNADALDKEFEKEGHRRDVKQSQACSAPACDYVWSFTTGAAADTTAPTVTLTVPADTATCALTNSSVAATFSESMDPATVTESTFILLQGATVVAGTVTYSGVTALFTPISSLEANTVYTATITTGAKDLAGNALAVTYVRSFTTCAAPDFINPTVILVNPADSASGVCTGKTIAATFSKAMDPLTITTANFSVAGVTGTVTYNAISRIATFIPVSDLAANTVYTATITTGVMDLAGNALASDYVWSFTTGATACTTQVTLGAAAPFGVFGAVGITNQGVFTVVNGDTGTTAASTLITGFHDTGGNVYTETPLNIGAVNGTIYTATAPPGSVPGVIAAAAALAAQAAFDSLSPAALPGGIDVSTLGGGAGELGGRTLAPGVYQSAPGSFAIAGGDLTLDAGGDPNALWVFQMATSLTVGGPGAAFPQSVLLINGAQAKNVYWQVGSAATINAAGGGTMVGTIISYATTSFSTAGNLAITTLEGRALALNASVTLVNTHVNVPAP